MLSDFSAICGLITTHEGCEDGCQLATSLSPLKTFPVSCHYKRLLLLGSLLKMNYINFSVAYQETLANKNKTTNDWTTAPNLEQKCPILNSISTEALDSWQIIFCQRVWWFSVERGSNPSFLSFCLSINSVQKSHAIIKALSLQKTRNSTTDYAKFHTALNINS